MPLLCFLVPIAFWPHLIEATNAPKWALLSVVVPFFLISVQWTRYHTLLAAFLAWCALTLLWAPAFWAGTERLWHFTVLGMVFMAAPKRLEWCLAAYAMGVAINGLVAIPQFFGWTGLPQAVEPAGLLMNKNYLAEAGLLALCSCLGAMRLRWVFLPPIAAALFLPVSRGAFVSAGLVLGLWLWRRSRILAVIVGISGIGFAVQQFHAKDLTHSDIGSRISFYSNSLVMVADKPWGHGVGSFWTTYPLYAHASRETTEKAYGTNVRPRTAHNDALTVAVETGLPGLAFLGVIAIVALRRAFTTASYVFVAFLALGMFNFPLFVPSTAFLGSLVAGHLVLHGQPIRRLFASRGSPHIQGA